LIFNYIFIASKHEKKLVYINLFITIFNIVWNIILIPKYSFIWAWITTLISQMILFILWLYFSRKIIKFDFDILYVLKVILFSIFLYIWWNYFLLNYTFWNVLDILIYWSWIFIIYLSFVLFLNRKLFLRFFK
jgi:O-antigen/teichoic acid export membrane protein